jgi:hypothetical protein
MFREGRVDGGITPEVVTTRDLSRQGSQVVERHLSPVLPNVFFFVDVIPAK